MSAMAMLRHLCLTKNVVRVILRCTMKALSQRLMVSSGRAHPFPNRGYLKYRGFLCIAAIA